MCGKSAQFGHNVSHSKRRTNRDWLPNIQKVTVVIDGRPQKMHLCTRCLRNQAKAAAK
jgi:large subunit ribosomal protein L28